MTVRSVVSVGVNNKTIELRKVGNLHELHITHSDAFMWPRKRTSGDAAAAAVVVLALFDVFASWSN